LALRFHLYNKDGFALLCSRRLSAVEDGFTFTTKLAMRFFAAEACELEVTAHHLRLDIKNKNPSPAFS
jgi:hypothetical protein